ncbi:MAG: hypothetical protein KBT03_10850 [Bacteroidales bacterium]|nr:hypothetical protein [Candidatus Scybalousia scybalohippi]
MSKTKIVLNSKGVRELLKSSEVRDYIKSEADAIKGRCGSGYATDSKYMGTRVISSVYTETKEAYQDNLENNTLLKASKA